MSVEAEVKPVSEIGAGMRGPFLRVRAATVSATPQTVSFSPFKFQDSTKVYVFRDVGPNDSAGALTSVSIDANGITFTPASTGWVGLLLAGDILEK